MTSKEVISEIIGMYEEMVGLKVENDKLRNEINNLKSFMHEPIDNVSDANEYLKLKFFNNLAKNLSWVKNNIFNEYSLPAVYSSDDNSESKYVIPFEKWVCFVNVNDIEDDILNFMSVDEVVELFRSQLSEIYNEKVAKFKKNNQ